VKQPKDRATSLHRKALADPLASQDAGYTRKFLAHEGPTPKRPLIVSATEVAEFLRCRVKHHWSSQLRLTTVVPNVPMSMGRVGHETLEAWYKLPVKRRTVKTMRALADKHIKQATVKELTTEDRELLTAMVTGYAGWVLSDDNEYSDTSIGLETCQPEEWFEENVVPDGSIKVRGKIDNFFFSTTLKRTVGMLESKFRAKMDEGADMVRLQDTLYLWAMRRRHPKQRRYVLYHQILRKQMPGPRVTAPLFSRELVERTDEELAQFELDLARIALDMLDGAVYPNRMPQCTWDCDFKVACQLRGSTADLKHVLEHEFRKREAQ
jgi:hypothetical protein